VIVAGALAKQFPNLRSQLTRSISDLNTVYSSKINWFFYQDGKSIASDQYDFMWVAVHETLHGLGFVSSWSAKDTRNPNLILPSIGTTQYNDGTVEFSGFSANLFDSFLVDASTNTKVTSYLDALTAAIPSGTVITSMNDVYDAVLANNASLAAVEAMFKLCTSNNLVFKPVLSDTNLDSESVYLEAAGPAFYNGRTISHLATSRYALSSDFLIVPDVTAGKDARKLATSAGGFLGPSILAVMNTLGYTVNVSGNGIVNSVNFGGASSRSSAPVNLVSLAGCILAVAATFIF